MFRYYIIENLAYISEYDSDPYKYCEQLKKDREPIIDGVSKAVSKIRDVKFKETAAKRLFLIKKHLASTA